MRAVHKLSVLMISLAVLALAACGGGSAKASTSSPSTTTTPGGRGFRSAAFTTCLKEHGVTLPSGGFGGRRGSASGGSGASGATGSGGARRGGFFGGGGGANLSAKDQAAFSACRSKLPNGGQFGGGGFGGGANATALKAYLSCLSDNGVKVPKTPAAPSGASGPSGTSGVGGFRSPLGSVRNDPKFAAARQKCRALLPARGGSNPNSSATTTPAG